MNKHLEDARNTLVQYSTEAPIRAEDVELHVEQKHHPEIHLMLRKYRDMWEGRVGKVNDAYHHINLITGARSFKSAPYREGPK